jgi:beta-glucanase (GH16 family)
MTTMEHAMQPSNTQDVIFFDDFTSDVLDRTKWNVEITGNIHNNEQQAYIDSSETIYLQQGMENANGALVIHPRSRDGYVTPQGSTFDFVSGRINTRERFELAYGTVSARIRLPVGGGLWPAFWMLGSSGNWPACGELDIMEYVGEPDWTSVAVHGPGYSGETPLVNKKYFLQPDDAAQWHIYSLEWMPDSLIFKIDEKLVYRVARPSVEYLGPWVFDARKFIIINFALGGVYPFKTNGVHMPYYGIPASTVEAIRNDEIKLLVDWVKVFRKKETPVAAPEP